MLTFGIWHSSYRVQSWELGATVSVEGLACGSQGLLTLNVPGLAWGFPQTAVRQGAGRDVKAATTTTAMTRSLQPPRSKDIRTTPRRLIGKKIGLSARLPKD